jgi:DNA end-binding protein Ku
LAEDAYRVVRDALRKSGKVALGQLTMRGRESLCALRPCGDGILLETLRYGDEIREAEPLFASIDDDASDDELLSVATSLIEQKTSKFDPDAFVDHYDKALRELIDRKRNNRKTPRARADGDDAPARGENVVDLMAALKASLKSSGSKSKPQAKPRKKSA